MAGTRPISNPEGKMTDKELLEVWKLVKEQGFISEDDPIPNRALNRAAVEMGICEWSDIGPKEIDVVGEETYTMEEALPDDAYNEAVRQFEEEYGLAPGRSWMRSETDFIVENLSTDRSTKEFGKRYLTADPPEESCEYETPRIKTKVVWNAYKAWCELNGIEHRKERDGAKSEIASAKDEIEMKYAKWLDDGSVSTYYGGKLNDKGWWIYNHLASNE
jgi:hypothetical protein